jgi:polyadenylation factor subunit 2
MANPYLAQQDQMQPVEQPVMLPPPFGHQRVVYDGKRMRKPITRRVVDFYSDSVNHVTTRAYAKHYNEYEALQPHEYFVIEMMEPLAYLHEPASSICTKFIHTSINKVRYPINCIVWTPEGRRLITGSSSGEFTLWNGFAFNFETILQAHDTAVRAMTWTNNENWMVTGDHGGVIKYWQPNMNNVQAFTAHKEAVRSISFCCTDVKFVSGSDDVTLKIWDFATWKEERTLSGHGWDVKDAQWHPYNSLIVSGSKDNLIKMWDSKSGRCITTIHGHKNTVTVTKWNKNGNWFMSGGRDQMLKLWDIRTMKEFQSFKGHKREVTAMAWHPYHETLFVSGSYDGAIMFWIVGSEENVGEIKYAHDNSVFDLQWHPLGHILASGSNDYATKFWCRNRPGETLEDKYNQPELFPEEVAQMEAEREEKGLHRKKERREGGDKDDDIETKVKEKKKAPLVPVNAQILPGFVGAMEWESLPPIPGLSVTLPTNKS